MSFTSLSVNHGEKIRTWDFKESKLANELFKDVRRHFADSEYSTQEAFEIKNVVQMKIVPVYEKGDRIVAASICPEAYFNPNKLGKIVSFVEKEYQK